MQSALAAHLSQQLSRPRLMREMTWYESWHVPSERDQSGEVGLRMLQGSGGEWWLLAFSDAAGLSSYATSTRLVPADQFVVVKGSSLFRNMPGGVAAIAFDVHSQQTATFRPPEIALLRQYGHAFEVEAALGRTSKRPDPLTYVRDYDGYRLLRHRQSGQFAFGADSSGRSGVAVFTTEDSLEAFLSQSPVGADPATERLMMGGAELFGRLAPTVGDLVVNCSGPTTIVLDSAFCRSVVDSAGSESAADGAGGASDGRGGAGPGGLFGERRPLSPLSKLPPLGDARPQHMAMCREVLPGALDGDPAGLTAKLIGPEGPSTLAMLWQKAAGNAASAPADGLDVVGFEQQAGTTLVVVRFPQARAMLEGHYAAIAHGPRGARYLLLERSTDDEEGALVDRTGGGRTNMGFVPVDVGAFVRAACEKIGMSATAPEAAARPSPDALPREGLDASAAAAIADINAALGGSRGPVGGQAAAAAGPSTGAGAWTGQGGGRAASAGLFGRRRPLVPDASLPPLADARGQYMAFGREVLPAEVARDGRGLVDRLRGPDASEVLAALWRQAAGAGPSEPPAGLEVIGVEEQSGTTLVVLQLPQARAMLEGHAAAVSVGPSGSRYFLFERSTDDVEAALVERTGGGRINMGFWPVELSELVQAVCTKIGLDPTATSQAALERTDPEAVREAAPTGGPTGAGSFSERFAAATVRPGLVGDRVAFEPSHVAPSQIEAVERHVASGQQMAKELGDFGLFVGACRLYTSTHAAIDPSSRMVEKGLAMIALGVCVAYQAGSGADPSMWLDGFHAAQIVGDPEKVAELAAIPEATIRAGGQDTPEHVLRYIRAQQQLVANDAAYRRTLADAVAEQPRVLESARPDKHGHVAMLSSLLATAVAGDESVFNAEMEHYLRFHHALYAAQPPKNRLGASIAIGAVAIAGTASKRGLALRVVSDYVPAWLVR